MGMPVLPGVSPKPVALTINPMMQILSRTKYTGWGGNYALHKQVSFGCEAPGSSA
jgi:hypothetical protein